MTKNLNFFRLILLSVSCLTFAAPRSLLKPHQIKLANGKNFTLNLPSDHDISVAAQGLSRARFMATSPDHRVFVTDLYNRTDNRKGVIYLLEDFDGSKFRSQKVWLNKLRNPNSIAFYTDAEGKHWLYIALTDKLIRYRYSVGEMKASSLPEALATFPDFGLGYKYGGWHLTRTIAIGANHKIYVSVGSSCNACEEKEEIRAAILEMDMDGKNQRVYAKGLRNAVGLRWIDGKLLTTNMGPDHLGDNKPDDTMYEVKENANYGWPYYYFSRSKYFPDAGFSDPKKLPVPKPFASFYAHSSPLGFEKFDDGFLVALHGSGFIRIGHGYTVAQVIPGKLPQDFITGFMVNRKINGRPVDIMKFENGFLLSDDYTGVVYFISRA